MVDTTRPFHWGRENPNYAGPTRAQEASDGQLSFDFLGDFDTGGDTSSVTEEVTFGRDDAYEVLSEFVGTWLDDTGNDGAAGVLIGPVGAEADPAPVTMKDFRDNPQSHIWPPSVYSSTRASISGDEEGITVDYGADSRGAWVVEVVESQDEFDAITAERADAVAEAEAARHARTEANVTRLRELAEDDPGFLVLGGKIASPWQGSERTYYLDTDKVTELGLDDDAVHDYVGGVLGDHLFDAHYDAETGVYSGFTD